MPLRLDGKFDGIYRIGYGSRIGRVQELQSHERRGPVDTDNSQRVISNRSDDAGNMGAVQIIIHGITAMGDGIEAVRSSGAGYFYSTDSHGETGRRRPDVCRQIRVGIVDSGVHHTYDVIAGAG